MARLGADESQRIAAIGVLRLVSMATKFALTFYVAHRLGLSDLGLFGLVTGVAVVVPVVASMGLMALLARQLVTLNLADVTRALSHYWRVIGLLYVVLLPPTLALGVWLGNPVPALATLLICLFEHLNNDRFAVLVARRQALLANVLFFLRTGIWMALFMVAALFVSAPLAMPLLLSIWIVFEIAALAGFSIGTRTWPSAPAASWSETWNWWRAHALPGLKFWASDTGNIAALYMDRFLIGALVGLETLGAYVVFWSVANAVYNLTETGALQINRPQLIDAHHRGDRSGYRKALGRMAKASLVSITILSIAASLVFPFVAALLNRQPVTAFTPVLWILLASGIVRVGFAILGDDIYARHQDTLFVATNLLALPLYLAFALALIPVWSLYGAAAAGGLVFILLVAARLLLIGRTT